MIEVIMKIRNKFLPVLPMLAMLAVLSTTLAVLGCAKPPTEEMDNARAALDRATADPNVAEYAAAQLKRAQDAFASMTAEAAAKRYDAAKTFAGEVVTASERAIAEAAQALERARNSAAQAIESARSEGDATAQALDAARAGRRSTVDLTEMDTRYGAARTVLDGAVVSNSQARYTQATEQAGRARADFSAITAQLSQASIAQSRKK
jgi:hypothetical protein